MALFKVFYAKMPLFFRFRLKRPPTLVPSQIASAPDNARRLQVFGCDKLACAAAGAAAMESESGGGGGGDRVEVGVA